MLSSLIRCPSIRELSTLLSVSISIISASCVNYSLYTDFGIFSFTSSANAVTPSDIIIANISTKHKNFLNFIIFISLCIASNCLLSIRCIFNELDGFRGACIKCVGGCAAIAARAGQCLAVRFNSFS